MNWRVPLSDLNYGIEEIDAAKKVLESGWLTSGRVTLKFEDEFAERIGVRHAIAVSNATAALHLSNVALGIGTGDEVIVPSLTFVATANAVRYTGATPIFADIVGEDNFGIAPEAIRACITSRTKAITVMHYGGYLCDMQAISGIANEHGLAIIEDAAHAPGADLHGKKAGGWGDVACFSFFGNKNLVTGEGGMVVTNRDDLAERIRLLRSHGMTSVTWDRHKGHSHSYDVIDLGYNYRTDEIRSALGLVQLHKLEENNLRRRNMTEIYRTELGKLESVSIPYGGYSGTSAAHLLPILLNADIDRSGFMQAMHSSGIQTSVHYPPIHQFNYYHRSGNSTNLPKTESIASREVSLPLYPTMTDKQITLAIATVKREIDRVVA